MAKPVKKKKRLLTVEIPEAVDMTVELYCTIYSVSKAYVVATALSQYLGSQKKELMEKVLASVATL